MFPANKILKLIFSKNSLAHRLRTETKQYFKKFSTNPAFKDTNLNRLISTQSLE